MKLHAKLKNERGGQKSTSDDTRLRVELFYGNKVIGEIGLYSIEKELGYRVMWVPEGATFSQYQDGEHGVIVQEEYKGVKKVTGDKQKGEVPCPVCDKPFLNGTCKECDAIVDKL